MNTAPLPRWRTVLAASLFAALAWAPSGQTQPTLGAPCPDALVSAEQRYTEQVFSAVEPLVLLCVADPDATDDDLVASYRLLALAFIKQDLMADAQESIVKILGVRYDYEPDRLADLPLYVALVDIVKGQLRVPVSAEPRQVEAAASPSPRSEAVTSRLIDVNTATAEVLDTVPGIGPAIAGRILTYREENGPFSSVAQLEEVRGIGPRTLERMAPYLTVGPGTTRTDSEADEAAPVAQPEDPMPTGEDRDETPTALGGRPKINLNVASAEELETLSGIGPALAARIVAFRTDYGPFRRVEDILLVRGIGPVTLERFVDAVTVE